MSQIMKTYILSIPLFAICLLPAEANSRILPKDAQKRITELESYITKFEDLVNKQHDLLVSQHQLNVDVADDIKDEIKTITEDLIEINKTTKEIETIKHELQKIVDTETISLKKILCDEELLRKDAFAYYKNELENLVKKHFPEIKETEKQLNETIAQLLAQQDNVQNEYRKSREWTETIINIWIALGAIAITIVSVLVPFLTKQKYDKQFKLQIDEQEDYIKFIELQSQALETKDISEKLRCYNQMIEKKPMHYSTYIKRAELYLNIPTPRNIDCAFDDYRKAIRYAKRNPERNTDLYKKALARTYWHCGQAFCKMKDYEGAIRNYSAALDLNKKYAHALFGMAMAYEHNNDANQAKELYEKAIESARKGTYIYYISKGYCTLLKPENTEWNFAIKEFTQAIKMKNKEPMGYYSRGLAYWKIKNYHKAIDDFSRAIEYDPLYADAYLYRGRSKCENSEYKDNTHTRDAINDMGKGIKLNYDYFRAYHNFKHQDSPLPDYSDTQSVKEIIDDIIKTITKSNVLRAEYANAHYYIGLAKCLLEKYKNIADVEKSIGDFEIAIELQVDHLAARNSLGLALVACLDNNKSDVLIKCDTEGCSLCYNADFSITPEGRRNFDIAFNHFLYAVENSTPNNVNRAIYYNNLAIMKMLDQKHDEVLNYLEKAIELKPTIANIYYNYAVIIYNIQKHDPTNFKIIKDLLYQATEYSGDNKDSNFHNKIAELLDKVEQASY